MRVIESPPRYEFQRAQRMHALLFKQIALVVLAVGTGTTYAFLLAEHAHRGAGAWAALGTCLATTMRIGLHLLRAGGPEAGQSGTTLSALRRLPPGCLVIDGPRRASKGTVDYVLIGPAGV